MSDPNPTRVSLGRFLALLGAGVTITLATGLVHGRLTQRWGPNPDLQAAARALASLPTKIGDWQFVSEEPIDERTRNMLSCAGYVNRRYVNRASGDTVSIAIIVGPAGPIAVHTPEICYSSRAHSIDGPRKRLTLSDSEGKTHSAWSLSFRPNNPSGDWLRICYAWRADADWTASEHPRFEFGGRPLLFKLQIASVVTSMATDTRFDPSKQFFAALLRSGWNLAVEHK